MPHNLLEKNSNRYLDLFLFYVAFNSQGDIAMGSLSNYQHEHLGHIQTGDLRG